MKTAALLMTVAALLAGIPYWQGTQTVPAPENTAETSVNTPAAAPAQAAQTPIRQPFETQTPVFSSESVPEAYRTAMTGLSWKAGCPVSLDKLRLLKVGYVGFDGRRMQGELVVHQAVADELTAIFRELYAAGYPLHHIELVDSYGADDTRSMEADNTSAFNFRQVTGSQKLSKHSYGIAIDINPVENPYVKGEYISPAAGSAFTDRTVVRPGMILPGDACHKAFASRGWTWGGNWKTLKDYQHFEKPLDVTTLK